MPDLIAIEYDAMHKAEEVRLKVTSKNPIAGMFHVSLRCPSADAAAA
jgi:hypothetical protein